MRIKECQGSITRACQKLEIRRFTHHDLRHLFATRCIESGVDIPTVARWLGHKDGGALAMKVYGHLRDQHSSNMAKRVTFDARPPTKDESAMTGPSQKRAGEPALERRRSNTVRCPSQHIGVSSPLLVWVVRPLVRHRDPLVGRLVFRQI
jgi:hypothetical protein